MNARLVAACVFAAVLLGAGPSPAPESAPKARIDIEKVTCGDLKAASPLDRAAIVMFYWGYAAAKAGATSFKTGVLENATDALMHECAGNASETVVNAIGRINVKAF